MRFRPCIDIHNGKVKQIVGGSLNDAANIVSENYVSEQDAAFFAHLYRESGLTGGHIIMLNPAGTPEYEADVSQAKLALSGYPGGLQIGGGINTANASRFLDMGASHVIVTSYVFRDGRIDYDRLNEMVKAVGREHLVLDLSCRRKKIDEADGSVSEEFFIVTDRWQKFTDEPLSPALFSQLAEFADEFLVHAVDVEGKASGVETELVTLLAEACGIPITYAGGVGSYDDIEKIRKLGKGKIDITIGSALDLFGGKLEFGKVLSYMD